MTANSRDTTFTFTMREEGDDALSLDPFDRGNWTAGETGVGALIGSKFGVSAPVLVKWLAPAKVTKADMRDLSRDTAEAIWTSGTWNALRGDDLPAGCDLMVSDMGYNAGEPTSARILQTLVGATPDGWIGPETLRRTNVAMATTPIYATLSKDAARAVQTQLCTAVDGIFGPSSQAAATNAPRGHVLIFLALLADAQADRYRALDEFDRYGSDWLGRTWRRLAAALVAAA